MTNPISGDIVEQDEQPLQTSVEVRAIKPEDIIDFTQSVRKTVADSIISQGVNKLIDEDRDALLRTLKDMDSTAINVQRVAVEKSGVDNDKQALAIIERLNQQRPYGMARPPGEEVDYTPIVDASALPSIEFTDEEKVVGITDRTSKDFMEEYEREQGISIDDDE